MAHPFEIDQQIDVPATPEQAWEAISTGKGLEGWFMGTNEVEPGEGGRIRTNHAGFTMDATITVWDPPNRLVERSEEAPDGAFHSFEYRIEEREKGRTAIRWIHTGALGGDWEAEYEAMSEGDPAYLFKLGQYLTYFFGRTAVPVDVFGPNIPDTARAREQLWGALGLPGPMAVDEEVHLTLEGIPSIDGVVDYLTPSFFGIRTDDALYRFIHGFEGTQVVGHHLYSDVDPKQAVEDWSAWLSRSFA